MFDVSGLSEIPLATWRGWQGKYYTDDSGTCIAKTCSICKEVLAAVNFSRDKSTKSGLCIRCKDCNYEYRRDKSSSHTKKIKDRYKNRTPDQLLSDRISLRPDGTKWCFRCGIVKSVDSFYPDKYRSDGLNDSCSVCIRAHKSSRRKEEFRIYWESKGIPLECYVCGGPWEHTDHVIAKNLGGSDEPPNRLPMCEMCNSSKGKIVLDEWLVWKFPDIADAVLHKVSVIYGIRYDPRISEL